MSTTIQVCESQTHIWQTNEGLKAILLHGEFGDAATYWKAITPALAARLALICPDLPGFGASTPMVDARLQTYLYWLRGLIDQVSDQPVILGGCGYGAVIARFYASRYPQQIRRLILSGGGDVVRPSPIQRWLGHLTGRSHNSVDPANSRTLGNLFYAPGDFCTPDFVRHAERERPAALRALRSLATDPLPTAWTPICPTLLIWGNEDRYCPLTRQRALAHELQDPRTVEIFEAGHLVMIEQPRRFVAHVLDFLQPVLLEANTPRS